MARLPEARAIKRIKILMSTAKLGLLRYLIDDIEANKQKAARCRLLVNGPLGLPSLDTRPNDRSMANAVNTIETELSKETILIFLLKGGSLPLARANSGRRL